MAVVQPYLQEKKTEKLNNLQPTCERAGIRSRISCPSEKEMATHSNIPPRESHGQRSLAGYSP